MGAALRQAQGPVVISEVDMAKNIEIKAWRCPNGHVMGRVVRNGSGMRRLLLYREAEPGADPHPGPLPIREREVEFEPEVMAVVEGYVADVTCSVCGAVRTWVPGQEAIDRLIERVRAINV